MYTEIVFVEEDEHGRWIGDPQKLWFGTLQYLPSKGDLLSIRRSVEIGDYDMWEVRSITYELPDGLGPNDGAGLLASVEIWVQRA